MSGKRALLASVGNINHEQVAKLFKSLKAFLTKEVVPHYIGVTEIEYTCQVSLTEPGFDFWVFTNRQLWWSLHDPEYKELLDTRGKYDVESPVGEWTKVECLCDGNRITIRVNGTTVNSAYDVSPAAGKILLQSEGFELFVRKFDLHPLERE